MRMCIGRWRPAANMPDMNGAVMSSIPSTDPAVRHDRIDAITGLRGLAALLVVYGHSVDWFSLPLVNHFSGEIGVTVFFALSGFLMAYLYIGRDFTALGVTEYAIHRFSRIAPAYLFILLLSVVICAALDCPLDFMGMPANNAPDKIPNTATIGRIFNFISPALIECERRLYRVRRASRFCNYP